MEVLWESLIAVFWYYWMRCSVGDEVGVRCGGVIIIARECVRLTALYNCECALLLELHHSVNSSISQRLSYYYACSGWYRNLIHSFLVNDHYASDLIILRFSNPKFDSKPSIQVYPVKPNLVVNARWINSCLFYGMMLPMKFDMDVVSFEAFHFVGFLVLVLISSWWLR